MKPHEPDPKADRPTLPRVHPRAVTAKNPRAPETNQGEGDRKADQAYRTNVERFVAKDAVQPAAQAAMRALEGPEAPELAAAEDAGKARTATKDPDLLRNDERSPAWWTGQHESAWQRMRHALERDWLQTKADLGLSGGLDLGQDVVDTLAQATGSEPSPPLLDPQPLVWDEARVALRFGFGASTHFVDASPEGVPSPRTIEILEQQWHALHPELPWSRVSPVVMRGYVSGRRA